jgi:hypothetical protein
MATIFQERIQQKQKTATSTMRALVFRGPNQIAIEHVPIPKAGPGEAVIRVTLTTICGTDLHILKGEYPVKPGLIIGHEPVGIIHELGVGVAGYKIGDRVLVGATQAFVLFLQYFILSLKPRDLFCGVLFCHIDKLTASRMEATTFLRKSV